MGGRCIVTGASSQIGEVLLPLLQGRFSQVLAWSRQAQPDLPGISWQSVDLADASVLEENVSHLIHLAPLTLLAPLLEAAQHPLRVVAISTCSARHKAYSASAAERKLAQAFIVAENQAIAMARSKGHQLTILRPTMLYGTGRDGTIAVLQKFALRFGFLLVPGQAPGLRQPVHVGDVAQAVVLCLAENKTIGKLYELGGKSQITLRQMCEKILTDNGRKARVLAVPVWPLKLAIHALRIFKIRPEWDVALLQRASQNQTVDNRVALHEFGYEPRPFDATVR